VITTISNNQELSVCKGAKRAFVNFVFSVSNCTFPVLFNNAMSDEMKNMVINDV
jgi:Na+/H+ antiporter NhaB